MISKNYKRTSFQHDHHNSWKRRDNRFFFKTVDNNDELTKRDKEKETNVGNNTIIIFIKNYIQEKEVIKYHIEDDILTIEITHKLSDNDKDSCIGDSIGEMEEESFIKYYIYK